MLKIDRFLATWRKYVGVLGLGFGLPLLSVEVISENRLSVLAFWWVAITLGSSLVVSVFIARAPSSTSSAPAST